MTAKRLWLVGGGLVIAVLLALGWFLLISPALGTIKDNEAQRDQVDAKNAQILRDIANLSKVDVDGLESDLAGRVAEIPERLVEEDIYQEVKDLGAQTGVIVTSVSISQPEAFATKQASAEGTDPAAPVAPGGKIAAPGLPISSADLQTANAAGMYDSTVDISVSGGFEQVRAFIDALTKQSSRTFLVTGAELNALGGAMSIHSVIWFKPRADDLLSGGD